MSENICVGDWVVAGRNRDDIEIGQIVSLDCGAEEMIGGDPIGGRVAWSSGIVTWCPVGAQHDVDVYGSRVEAAAEAARRFALLDEVQS